MADKEPETIPIVEHLPNAQQPHPSLDGAPEGTIGQPGVHLEHEPIEDGGKVIAAPHEGYGQKVETVPPEEAGGPERSGFWRRIFRVRQEEKQELPKAA